ncbi:MAG: hypothetical protein ACRC3G_04350 [Bacteroidales bacterium]
MEKEILLKAEFNKWLIDIAGISEESAKSYLSYVAGANKTVILTDGGKDKTLFEIIQTEYDKQKFNNIEEAILLVVEELSRKNAASIFDRPESTLHKYRSGLYRYLEFLLEQSISIDQNQTEESEEVDSAEEPTISIRTTLTEDAEGKEFSKDELVKNFSLRIKTQDRCYQEIFFPIRFINRVFSKKNERKEFNSWLKNLLDSIVIFTEGGNKLKFKEIDALMIVNENVYITTGGTQKGEHLAYTKLSDNKTLEPFKVKMLRQVSIDHEISLSDIMRANQSRLSIISEITSTLKKHIRGSVTYSKLSKASHSDKLNDFIQTVNTQNLLEELKIISDATCLQLMDSSQNTKKGKN